MNSGEVKVEVNRKKDRKKDRKKAIIKEQYVIIGFVMADVLHALIFAVGMGEFNILHMLANAILWTMLCLRLKWALGINIVCRMILVLGMLIPFSDANDVGSLMVPLYGGGLYDICAFLCISIIFQPEGKTERRLPLAEKIKNPKSYKAVQLFIIFMLLVFLKLFCYNIGGDFAIRAYGIIKYMLLFAACLNNSLARIKRELAVSVIAGIVFWALNILLNKGLEALALRGNYEWIGRIIPVIICLAIALLIVLCKKLLLAEKMHIVKDAALCVTSIIGMVLWCTFLSISVQLFMKSAEFIQNEATLSYVFYADVCDLPAIFAFIGFAVSFSLFFYADSKSDEPSVEGIAAGEGEDKVETSIGRKAEIAMALTLALVVIGAKGIASAECLEVKDTADVKAIMQMDPDDLSEGDYKTLIEAFEGMSEEEQVEFIEAGYLCTPQVKLENMFTGYRYTLSPVFSKMAEEYKVEIYAIEDYDVVELHYITGSSANERSLTPQEQAIVRKTRNANMALGLKNDSRVLYGFRGEGLRVTLNEAFPPTGGIESVHMTGSKNSDTIYGEQDFMVGGTSSAYSCLRDSSQRFLPVDEPSESLEDDNFTRLMDSAAGHLAFAFLQKSGDIPAGVPAPSGEYRMLVEGWQARKVAQWKNKSEEYYEEWIHLELASEALSVGGFRTSIEGNKHTDYGHDFGYKSINLLYLTDSANSNEVPIDERLEVYKELFGLKDDAITLAECNAFLHEECDNRAFVRAKIYAYTYCYNNIVADKDLNEEINHTFEKQIESFKKQRDAGISGFTTWG